MFYDKKCKTGLSIWIYNENEIWVKNVINWIWPIFENSIQQKVIFTFKNEITSIDVLDIAFSDKSGTSRTTIIEGTKTFSIKDNKGSIEYLTAAFKAIKSGT